MKRKSQVNQAMSEGLQYTGITSSDKEEVKERIKKERAEKKGARIILVTERCRGRIYDTSMYSAYADKVYFAYDTVKKLADHESRHDADLMKIEKEYADNVMAAKERYEKRVERYENALAILEKIK